MGNVGLYQPKMACVENIPPVNGDSEMEEGEIVDDVDYLSDISSEEEFLLRQRLHVLETYNDVLERKKAKRSFTGSGKPRREQRLPDLSDISASDLDNSAPCKSILVYRPKLISKHKTHSKHKSRGDQNPHTNSTINKDNDKKKLHRRKKLELKVISESSEESDDEYRNKRRKLADAVIVKGHINNDRSSLQDRIKKMMLGTKPQKNVQQILVDKETETDTQPKLENVSSSPISNSCDKSTDVPTHTPNQSQEEVNVPKQLECIVLSTDDDVEDVELANANEKPQDVVDSSVKDKNDDISRPNNKASDSDEDLELLRQHALKTKASKAKQPEPTPAPTRKPVVSEEDSDSDTAALRRLCLDLSKRAIEMKQKQKLRKRLSQSSSLNDELLREVEMMSKIESDNNTDIESMDMEIGSDGDEKSKDASNESTVFNKDINIEGNKVTEKSLDASASKHNVDEDLDEDVDLLRAKLLTSLSKNLPTLVDPSLINSTEEEKSPEKTAPAPKPKKKLPENRIVINPGESDSEEEHEATKNLTKMHMKLSEQLDFQEKLDMFLKSTRMEVEKTKLPDLVQPPTVLPKTPEKYVAKAVNHLPKSEQIEYRNLVKRMSELEKLREARQSTVNLASKIQVKDTLKPRNVTVDPRKLIVMKNSLEEQIALSRKNIAEESATMLKLKEEATKLTQKYKIVANELKNISTAITLNKKQQRMVQSRLQRNRAQHQRLLLSSKHSKVNGQILSLNRPSNIYTSNLSKKEQTTNIVQSVKVSVVNDVVQETVLQNATSRLVEANEKEETSRVASVKIPNGNDRVSLEVVTENGSSLPVVEKGGGNSDTVENPYQSNGKMEFDDYESPLRALGKATWEGDPNAILCPFEVGGHCKDPDCKYLHPKAPSQ